MTKQMFEITLRWADGTRDTFKACGLNAADAKNKILQTYKTANVDSCVFCYEYEA